MLIEFVGSQRPGGILLEINSLFLVIDEVTDGNGRKQSELTHDAAEIPSETAGNTKEKLGTNQTKPTANLAQEILRRKNLEFEFRQETIAKKASEKAGKHRRLSTGKLSKKEKGEMISNEKPSNVESYRNNNSRSNSLAEDRMHNITINHKAKNEKKVICEHLFFQ